MSHITHLVIHCAATPNGQWVTAQDLDARHHQRGSRRDMRIAPHQAPMLPHIGYHYVIYTTGRIRTARPLIETGAHAGHHNAGSIAICIIGTDRYSLAQWRGLAAHVRALLQRFPDLKITGHRDLAPWGMKESIDEVSKHRHYPGFSVQAWLAGCMLPLRAHLMGSGNNGRASL